MRWRELVGRQPAITRLNDEEVRAGPLLSVNPHPLTGEEREVVSYWTAIPGTEPQAYRRWVFPADA